MTPPAPPTTELPAVAQEAAARLALRDVEPCGAGLEFQVFRARDEVGNWSALRVPRAHTYRTPGELPLPAVRLQRQEHRIYGFVRQGDFPAPNPGTLLPDVHGMPVLVSQFVASDGTVAAPEELGALLARLHLLPAEQGRFSPVTHEGVNPLTALVKRVTRRWAQLAPVLPALPAMPARTTLLGALRPLRAQAASLLHMDLRTDNLLARSHRVVAVVDWSSAMVAHPVIEFSRLWEFSAIPENGTDMKGITSGYRRHLRIPHAGFAAEAVARLDAVTMMAVVFAFYAPDDKRLSWAAERISELTHEIARSTSHARIARDSGTRPRQ
jgi:aminoglycoside phosphotransferase (APT) family kinase protein